MEYRPIDLTKENERVVAMVSGWYRELVGSYQNPIHQTEWPLGIVENKEMNVRYIGAYDGEALAGMIGYTTVFFETKISHEMRGLPRRLAPPRNDNLKKPLAVFEIMMFVREEFRGKGIATELWKQLVDFAHDQELPLWVGNNTEGGDASLKKAVGQEKAQIHKLTVLTHNPS